jgi:hypothetical protein
VFKVRLFVYPFVLRQIQPSSSSEMAASVPKVVKPVLHVAASPRQSRRPETAPDPFLQLKDNEEDED